MHNALIIKGFLKRAKEAGLNQKQSEQLLKEAGLASMLGGAAKNTGNFMMEHPFKSMGRAVGYGALGPLAVGAPFAAGETAYRTYDNIFNKHVNEVGIPTTTGSAVAAPIHYILQATGLSPLLQNVARSGAEGAMNSPAVNQFADKALNTSQNIKDIATSPAVQEGVSTLHQGTDIAHRLTDPETSPKAIDAIRNAAGAAGQGAAEGFGRGMFKDPYTLPLYGAAALSPVIAYDLATRRKREERARMDNELLRYLRGKKKIEPTVKQASVVDFLKRIIYSHNVIDPTKLESMTGAARAAGKGIEPGQLEKMLAQHHSPFNSANWSLLNNPLSRNPGKTLLGAGVAPGLMLGYKENFDSPDKSILHSIHGGVKGLVQGPLNMFKSLEMKPFTAGGRYDALGAGPTMDKLTATQKNLTDSAHAVMNPDNIPARPLPGAGSTAPAMHSDFRSAWPYYGAAAGALAAPYAAYSIYDRHHNKNRRTLDEENQTMVDQLPQLPTNQPPQLNA